jgi:hypothetical protein
MSIPSLLAKSRMALGALALGLATACSAGGGELGPPGMGAGGAGNEGPGGSGPASTGGTYYGTGGSGPGGMGGSASPGTGGTGGSTNPGTGGASVGTGGALPYGGYDPTIQFVWPDTTPTAGSCKAGEYTGTFDGWYTSPVAFILPVPIFGNVMHRLEQAASGEFFEIKDGRVEGTADTPIGPVPFEADFVGELDCATNQLRNAQLLNGSYTIDPNTYYFEGPVEAMYDRLANQFINGTWAVGEPTYSQPPPLYGGSGTWTTRWTGP